MTDSEVTIPENLYFILFFIRVVDKKICKLKLFFPLLPQKMLVDILYVLALTMSHEGEKVCRHTCSIIE